MSIREIFAKKQKNEPSNMEEKNDNQYMQTEAEIVHVLRGIYDPEIPVNIYDLGLIYRIELDDYNNLDVDMTLTAPNCPVADNIVNEVRDKLRAIKGIERLNVNLVFDPPWTQDLMSEVAKLELGFM